MLGRGAILCAVLLVSGCSSVQDTVTAKIDQEAIFQYGSYCAAPPDARRSALSYAETGFGYVEQQCGVFFDNLAALTQSGRFSIKALNATNLGTQSILQAAKVASSNVTLVGSAITLTEAVFNAFVEQYAFSPYLYKIRELTWQAFDKHSRDNQAKLASLNIAASPDAYCSAYVLVQQHASICTLSYIQMLFDQQVANSTKVVDSNEKAKEKVVPVARGAQPRTLSLAPASAAPRFSPRPPTILPASPSYSVQ
ncbi:exported hypothetical protein [Bradyrhizobium sp. ORS 375]|uniref:hypothetical protein n=1 Tax=Bradyrhizobium sp. (strain ORS 375) TaxID=566679 RepID=UPI0002407574|nr:hypothetical protein [Bradyrhizobium sp. ORS 375]CCD96015.1 exported hypothetical protein [Bradyrhizobium sp. ORS 375]